MAKKILDKKRIMPKHFFIYPLFSVLFLIILGALLLFANGYSLALKDNHLKLEKTGMIIVSVRPMDSRIIINGKFKENSAFYLLQNKITNLFPDTYNIRIEKKGYRTWEKNIVVEPGLVSWANYVILFPEDLDIRNIKEPSGKLIARSKNNDNLLFAESKDGVFAATSMGVSGAVTKSFWPQNVTSLPDWMKNPQVVAASYSENSDKILFEIMNGTTKEYVISESSGSEVKTTILNDQIKQNPDSASWDQYDNSSLFITVAGSLYHLSQNATSLNNIVATNVVTYFPETNRQLYYSTKSESGNVSIMRSSFDGGSKVTLLEAQATSGNYKLTHSNIDDTLAILNKDNGELQLISPANGGNSTIQKFGKGYRDIVWQKNGQKLLFYNENTISRYDLEREKQTDFHYEKKISSVAWYFDENHYLVNGEKGLEIMDYDGTNSVVLSSSQAESVILDSLNNNLIYALARDAVSEYFSFNSPY